MAKLSAVDSYPKQLFDHVYEYVHENAVRVFGLWRMVWHDYPEVASAIIILVAVVYMLYNNHQLKRYRQHALHCSSRDHDHPTTDNDEQAPPRILSRLEAFRRGAANPKQQTEKWYNDAKDGKKYT